MEHTKHLQKGDLVLMDRNYPCFYLFSMFFSQGIDFCSRVKSGSWKAAKQLANSNQRELITTILPSKQSKKVCEEKGLPIQPLEVRFIKVILDTGEIEILITSLVNQTRYPVDIFGKLYFLRWGIEESYKSYKHKLEIENFSGKSPISVFQDVYAKVFSSNLAHILASDAREKLKNKKGKYEYKINKANAYSKMKNTIVLLFYPDKRQEIIEPLLKLFSIKPIPIIPNRAFERYKSRYHPRKYNMEYKRC